MFLKKISNNLKCTFFIIILFILTWVSFGSAKWKTYEVQKSFNQFILNIVLIAISAEQVLKIESFRRFLKLRDLNDIKEKPYYTEIFPYLKSLLILILAISLIIFYMDLLEVNNLFLSLLRTFRIYIASAVVYACGNYIFLYYKN